MTKVQDVIDFVKVPKELWTQFIEKVGDPEDDIQLLACLSHDQVKEAIDMIKTTSDEGPPKDLSKIRKAQIGMVWRLARLVAHINGGQTRAYFLDTDPFTGKTSAIVAEVPDPGPDQGSQALSALRGPGGLDHEVAGSGDGTLMLTDAGGLPSGSSVIKVVGSRRVALKEVIDQGDATEVEPASESMHEAWLKNYFDDARAWPTAVTEPTLDQLTALHYRVVTLRQPPYVDFAVWVPYGRRAGRALKFRTWVPLGDGSFAIRMVPGPENFVLWMASWKVFAVACRMMQFLSRAVLELYFERIEALNLHYGDAWHLIVEADQKAREDQTARILRQIKAKSPSQHPSDYVASMPWDCVFRIIAEDNRFWDEAVIAPANTWLARGGRGVPVPPDEALVRTIAPGTVWDVPLEKMVSHKNNAAARSGAASSSTGRSGSGADDLKIMMEAIKDMKQQINGLKRGGNNNDNHRNVKQKVTTGLLPTSFKKLRKNDPRFAHFWKTQGKEVSQQICLLANAGHGSSPCSTAGAGTVCPSGRIHGCAQCGSTEHIGANHA